MHYLLNYIIIKILEKKNSKMSCNNTCVFILTRGKNKGNSCGKKTVNGKQSCSTHSKKESVVEVEEKKPVVEEKKVEEKKVEEKKVAVEEKKVAVEEEDLFGSDDEENEIREDMISEVFGEKVEKKVEEEDEDKGKKFAALRRSHKKEQEERKKKLQEMKRIYGDDGMSSEEKKEIEDILRVVKPEPKKKSNLTLEEIKAKYLNNARINKENKEKGLIKMF